jgi:hypothetical protein
MEMMPATWNESVMWREKIGVADEYDKTPPSMRDTTAKF